MIVNAPQKNLTQWQIRFTLANIFLLYAVGILYFVMTDVSFNTYTLLFTFFMLLGQMGLMGILMLFIPGFLISLIIRKATLLFIIYLFLTIILWLYIAVDLFTYSVYHYHINGLVLSMIFSPAILNLFDLSWLEWLIVGALLFLIVIAEILIIICAWKFQNKSRRPFRTAAIFGAIMISFITSELLYTWADATDDTTVTSSSLALPLYFGLNSSRFLFKHGMIKANVLLEAHAEQERIMSSGTLHDPLHALKETALNEKLNLLIIGIDAWRADSFTPDITPNIAQFAQQAWIFRNHYSGGNCTKAGLFSLFYGIPSTYWQSTHKSPILLEEMQKDQYQLGIYFSASLYEPAFYENILSEIKNLHMTTPGSSSWQRDQTITDNLIHFLQEAKTQGKPFFGFAFYDSAHNYDFSPDFKSPFNPYWKTVNHLELNNHFDPLPVFNRYKNSLYYDDQLIGRVLQTLQTLNLLKNTVVVITSDHGEEFNDNHQNYWGHTSNFTAYQTHVPLIVYWPNHPHQEFDYKTSHYDIVPTLLQGMFNITNPISDYSIGKNLLTPISWNYLLIGSYAYYGLVTDNNIITFFPGGYYRVYDLNNHPLPHNPIDMTKFINVLKLMGQYYN